MADITDIWKKMGLFGIGVLSMTQEKIEEFTREMVKKGEISSEEGKKFVKEALSEKDRLIKETQEKINEMVRETMKKSGLVMKDDIAALEKKIQELEEKLQ